MTTPPVPAIPPTITLAQFRDLMPQFANASDALVNAAIAASVSSFNLPLWGDSYLLGVSNWIAHQLQLNPAVNPAAAASVMGTTQVAKQAGNVRVQHDAGLIRDRNKNPFLRTYYGQQYLYYRSQVTAGMILAI